MRHYKQTDLMLVTLPKANKIFAFMQKAKDLLCENLNV